MAKMAEKEKRKQHYLLPIMGLVIAVALAAVSYLLSPIVIDLIKTQMGPAKLNQRLGTFSQQNVEYAFAVVLWLVLFAASLMIVAAALGEDPEKEQQILRPRDSASDKEWQKYEKKMAEIKAKRVKRAEQLAKEEERRGK